jgi:hypothetical protein
MVVVSAMVNGRTVRGQGVHGKIRGGIAVIMQLNCSRVYRNSIAINNIPEN